ncbi:hypothetical protein ACWCW7_18435 [Nocardia tengchongensis]
MTVVDQPVHAEPPATAPSVAELPLAPLTWRSVPRMVETILEFAGVIDDPGLRMRDTGEIFRLAFPNLPNPLKAFITESFVDGFAGETVIITSPPTGPRAVQLAARATRPRGRQEVSALPARRAVSVHGRGS